MLANLYATPFRLTVDMAPRNMSRHLFGSATP